MRRFRLAVMLTGFIPALAMREGNSAGTGFEFLRTELSPRQAGLGGAFLAMDGEINGLTLNPAGLAALKRREATFSYVDYLLDFQLGFIGVSSPLKNGATAGFGIGYANYGEFQWTDEAGQSTGSSTPGDFLLTGAYSGILDRNWRYGVSARYIRSSIQEYSADALAFNAGLIRKFPDQRLTVAAAVLNAGKGLNAFVDRVEKTPVSVAAGFTKRLAHLPLLIAFDAVKSLEGSESAADNLSWALGGEFTVSRVLLLRFGYNSRGGQVKMGSSSGRLSGVSFGLGTVIRNFQIDFGRASYGALGSVNHLGVTLDY